MTDKPNTGTILFEVALLTIVVFLVDEWLIRGALAFIPAMLLAQRALDATKASNEFAPAALGSGAVVESTNKLLAVFREFYTMCHLLGSGGITSEEAHQRTMDLEKDLDTLLDEVTATTASPAEAGAASHPVGAGPQAAASEVAASEVPSGLPTL